MCVCMICVCMCLKYQYESSIFIISHLHHPPYSHGRQRTHFMNYMLKGLWHIHIHCPPFFIPHISTANHISMDWLK